MSRICHNSNCACFNQEFSVLLDKCPVCHVPFNLTESSKAGFCLNLGDANAISGGVNLSDNHSINTTSNVDSHNVITNNITQVEREKSSEEIKHERELAFREACLEVYRNGIMTSEQKCKLEDLQYRLGLDEISASKILSEVAKRSERKLLSLSPVHQITFNNIKTAINSNRLDLVNRLLAQMKAMVQRYTVEEVQFTYYMLQAVLHPKECVQEFESQFEDEYWQTFWTSVAYCRVGNNNLSADLMVTLNSKWQDAPTDDSLILMSVNALLSNDIDIAKSYIENLVGDYSSVLYNLSSSLTAIFYSDVLDKEQLKEFQKNGAFYTNNLFSEIANQISAEKRKLEEAEAKRIAEEKRIQEEAEAKRMQEEAEAKRLAEEKRIQEEAEAKRLAEEKRMQEEAEAKRLAEEKRIQEEAEAKRHAEEKRIQEEAEAKRLAEEKRIQEEAEAKRIAEEKRIQEEAEAKRLAEEKRIQEEAEAKRHAELLAKDVDTIVECEKGTQNGHDYVDLGLSVKWATMNIGATRPEEYGDYIAWGETKTSKSFCGGNYKYSNGLFNKINKYCTDSSLGYRFFKDNKTVLDLEDDAAHVNWGGLWRMPTHKEQDELHKNCTWTWTTLNGVNGYKVQSKKTGYTDNWIFLPAAGSRSGNNCLDGEGSVGDYWSSSLSTDDPCSAYCLYVGPGGVRWRLRRYYGLSVRPVCP